MRRSAVASPVERKVGRQHLLTDGTHYLVEQAGCYWLMDAVASHLAEIGTTVRTHLDNTFRKVGVGTRAAPVHKLSP
ncbi:MAG: DUF6876 family protein [Betaproteobacteria bacterium]